MRRGLLTSAVLALTLGVAGVAYADLTVVVHVDGDVEGVTVRVTNRRDGAVHDCTTDVHGECTVAGVEPGTVFVEAQSGPLSVGRHVLIPEDGKVSIIVPNPSTANPPPPSVEAPTAPPTE